jgi:hypothetical protein
VDRHSFSTGLNLTLHSKTSIFSTAITLEFRLDVPVQ